MVDASGRPEEAGLPERGLRGLGCVRVRGKDDQRAVIPGCRVTEARMNSTQRSLSRGFAQYRVLHVSGWRVQAGRTYPQHDGLR